jgi:hypothetical protein
MIAKRDHGSIKNMVDKHATLIRKRAVQERSVAVSAFKTVWLSNASPFALVTNVLVTDLANNEGIKNTLEMILDKHILTANFATHNRRDDSKPGPSRDGCNDGYSSSRSVEV